jgi:hypothetical protein
MTNAGPKLGIVTMMVLSILGAPGLASADVGVSGQGNRAVASAEESKRRAMDGFPTPRMSPIAATGSGRAVSRESPCFFRAGSGPEEAQRYERSFRCGARGTVASEPDEAAPQEEPELTEGDVRRAVSEVPMPALRVTVQPGGRTLVNVPTILHTDPRSVRESITLLGHDIDVEATPTGYTWHHGDGTSRTTTRPGRPYPAKDVTHTYQRTADQVSIRVDTTYTVRYRVDGGAWTPLGQPLTATGAATPLEVAEAARVLVSPRR